MAIDNFNKQDLKDLELNIDILYNLCIKRYGAEQNLDQYSKIKTIEKILLNEEPDYLKILNNLKLLESLTDKNSIYWNFKK